MFFFAALALGPEHAFAKPGPRSIAKTEITSETMTVRNKDHQALFQGKVVLTRGSLVVRSDVMVVFYDTPDENRDQGPDETQSVDTQSGGTNLSIKRIEATGRVRIERQEGRATCRKAVYYEDEQKIVLTGEPVAWQEGNRVTGEKITLFLAEDRTIVEGGSRLMLEEVEGVR